MAQIAVRRNSSVSTFANPTGTWQVPAHASLWTAATGGDFLGSSPLTGNVAAPVADTIVRFPPRALEVEVLHDQGMVDEDREFSLVGATRSLNAFTTTTVYAGLHTSEPGADGANEFTAALSPGYARVAVTLGPVEAM